MSYKERTGFEGGLWIIPLILFLAGVWSIFFRAIPQWKSGSCAYVGEPPVWTCDETIRVSFWSIGATVFGLVFFVTCALCIWLMRRER